MRSFFKKLIMLDMENGENMELLSGIFAVVSAILVFLTTLSTKKSFSASAIQPQTVPQILCVIMAILGTLLIVRWCIRKKKGLIKPAAKTEKGSPDRNEVFRSLTPPVCFILMGLYVWTLKPLGFITASTMYLTVQIPFLATDLSAKSILKAFLIGAATAVISYLIFVVGFGLRLPMNRLGF